MIDEDTRTKLNKFHSYKKKIRKKEKVQKTRGYVTDVVREGERKRERERESARERERERGRERERERGV